MDSIGIAISEELKDRIDKQRAKEGVRTGETPSRSEWFRRLARQELEAADSGTRSAVEA